jgi:hypothetical protein
VQPLLVQSLARLVVSEDLLEASFAPSAVILPKQTPQIDNLGVTGLLSGYRDFPPRSPAWLSVEGNSCYSCKGGFVRGELRLLGCHPAENVPTNAGFRVWGIGFSVQSLGLLPRCCQPGSGFGFQSLMFGT